MRGTILLILRILKSCQTMLCEYGALGVDATVTVPIIFRRWVRRHVARVPETLEYLSSSELRMHLQDQRCHTGGQRRREARTRPGIVVNPPCRPDNTDARRQKLQLWTMRT